MLQGLLSRPHQEVREIKGRISGTEVTVADFSHLPTRCKFIAFMPQWDFLDFLAGEARRYGSFRLFMRAEATDLVEEGGRVHGVRARTPDGTISIRADLVIAADGRHSTMRTQAGLQVEDLGAPIDVLWFRLSRRAGEPETAMGNFDAGRILVLINRGDYYQCGLVIPKGGFEEVKRAGIEAFRASVTALEPMMADRVGEIASFEDVKLLTVAVDRLERWHRPGLLCIGDAAHAMSPVGGVGINLAVQDAVAASNLLAGPLRRGSVAERDLAAVQRRRELPAAVIQRIQVVVQDRILRRALASRRSLSVPWPLRLFRTLPFLRRIPARLIGMGIRPEHVRTSELPPAEA
jgi:2-polyprenyl-6-methoxyphenol hydroxylase-like FAD-dependent oxidoreductase